MKFATTLLVASATAGTVVDPVAATTKCPAVSAGDKTTNTKSSEATPTDWTTYLKNDPLTSDTATELTALDACHKTNVKGKVTELETDAKGGVCIVEFNKW